MTQCYTEKSRGFERKERGKAGPQPTWYLRLRIDTFALETDCIICRLATCGFMPQIRAVVQLVGGLLENSGAAPAQDPRRGNNNPQGAGAISTEIVRTMREQGMVRALTAALSTINMEHPRAHQAVQAILRPLELLTRNAGAWAPKLAGCGGALGGVLTSGPTTTRGASVVRQPEGVLV